MSDGPADRAQTYDIDKDVAVKKRADDVTSNFQRTGSYRVQDVIDILGDPRDHVEIKSPNASRVASWTDG